MKRPLLMLAAFALVTACRDRAEPTAITPPRPSASITAPASVTIDPALTAAVSTAGAADQFQVIVTYDDTFTTRDAVTEAVLDAGAGAVGFKQLPMVTALATRDQINAIAATPGIESVYLNKSLRYLLAESVASIRADVVRASGITGKGVGVAILDSGVDGLYNPDLAYPGHTTHNVKVIADLRELFTFKGHAPVTSLFTSDVPNSETSVGHGTHVAGIAAGQGIASKGKYTGVAPGANVIGIGTGDILFIFWALAGFDYILDHQADYNIQVVNNSWGTSGAFDRKDPINVATKRVHDKGVTVVFASGNEGPDANTLNPYSVAPWVIGAAAGCKVLSIIGTDPTNSAAHCADGRQSLLADFSSRGIAGDPLYHPTITAPGVHIASTRAATGTVLNALDANHDARICAISLTDDAYYTCASGTSMASPHVAGVAALMEEASGGKLSPDRTKDILTATAAPMPGYGQWEVGAGYLDALAAVNCAKNPTSCLH